MPLPAEAFDPARLLEARVDNRARVSVRQCFYSVPARYAGAACGPAGGTTVEILDGARLVARHERAVGRYVEVLALDHYLEVLQDQARRAARRHRAGPGQGRRGVHRSHRATGTRPAGPRRRRRHPGADRGPARPPHHARRRADRRDGPRCRRRRAWTPQVVLIDARRDTAPVAPVVPIGALARYDRPAPSLTDYDDLLTGSGT